MPVIKKTYNFSITNETDCVVQYKDYKERVFNLVALDKITTTLYEQLDELLSPTDLDISFDISTHTMRAWGMDFLLAVGQTWCYEGYVNIHPFVACHGDVTISTSLQSCRMGGKYGPNPSSRQESSWNDSNISTGPKGSMLKVPYSGGTSWGYFFSNVNNTEYVDSQMSLTNHVSEFPSEYNYTIIIYYNTNYVIVQYESFNGLIVPMFCIIKGKTYENTPVLLMSYDINSNGDIQTYRYDDNGIGCQWFSKVKIRFPGHQYDNTASYMLPGVPEWRDLGEYQGSDGTFYDGLLHAGSVRNWRGCLQRTEDDYNRQKNIKFYNYYDCRGVFTKIVFDYSPRECIALGINDGKMIMCPPICMGGLITFDNMWCVPETTIRNKVLSIDGDNYIVPSASLRHIFSWTEMGRYGGGYNAKIDQFYMFKL